MHILCLLLGCLYNAALDVCFKREIHILWMLLLMFIEKDEMYILCITLRVFIENMTHMHYVCCLEYLLKGINMLIGKVD